MNNNEKENNNKININLNIKKWIWIILIVVLLLFEITKSTPEKDIVKTKYNTGKLLVNNKIPNINTPNINIENIKKENNLNFKPTLSDKSNQLIFYLMDENYKFNFNFGLNNIGKDDILLDQNKINYKLYYNNNLLLENNIDFTNKIPAKELKTVNLDLNNYFKEGKNKYSLIITLKHNNDSLKLEIPVYGAFKNNSDTNSYNKKTNSIDDENKGDKIKEIINKIKDDNIIEINDSKTEEKLESILDNFVDISDTDLSFEFKDNKLNLTQNIEKRIFFNNKEYFHLKDVITKLSNDWKEEHYIINELNNDLYYIQSHNATEENHNIISEDNLKIKKDQEIDKEEDINKDDVIDNINDDLLEDKPFRLFLNTNEEDKILIKYKGDHKYYIFTLNKKEYREYNQEEDKIILLNFNDNSKPNIKELKLGNNNIDEKFLNNNNLLFIIDKDIYKSISLKDIYYLQKAKIDKSFILSLKNIGINLANNKSI